MTFKEMGAIQPAEHGDSYAEEVICRFVGSWTTTCKRGAIDLDAI